MGVLNYSMFHKNVLAIGCGNVAYPRLYSNSVTQRGSPRYCLTRTSFQTVKTHDLHTQFPNIFKWSTGRAKYSTVFRAANKNHKPLRNSVREVRLFGTMSGKGPGLIVFDLDCTLWPHHVDTTVNPPFIQKGSQVVDQDGVTIRFYPEVPEVLEYLKSEGYAIGAASRTTKPPAAHQLLQFFDWDKYFKYKEIYPGSKVTHFAKFVEQTNIPHNEMLFFDDEPRNIIDMEKEGVKCVLVEDGVNLQLVKDSIQKFQNGQL